MKTALASATAALVLFLSPLGACNGVVAPSVGSETNWVGGCERDDQCIRGRCVCGLCTDACDESTPCPGAETCAAPGSNPFASTCAGVTDKPRGVCLQGCQSDVDCAGAYRCESGACVPLPAPRSATGTQAMAPLQKVPLGASCILPDESSPDFPGYNTTEINTQDHDAQCASGFCIGVNFRGRATCTYGQPPDPANPAVADPAKRTCRTPGTNQVVTVPVEPQLVSRPPDVAVYCSCRCDGPDGTGPFCACPSGFECTNLVPDIGSHAELAGSYCLKAGTAVHAPTLLDAGPSCSLAELNCGPPP